MKKTYKRNAIKIAGKVLITGCSMLAINDFLSYYAPDRCSQTLHRVGNNIAGLSLGCLVGQVVGNCVVDTIENVIDGYFHGFDLEEE